MNVADIRVAPAATSFRLLSKSNSASSPTARLAAEVTVPPAAVTRALNEPFRGERLLPSTEIFERLERRSQRSRSVETTSALAAFPDDTVVASDEPDGVSTSPPHPAAAVMIPARTSPRSDC